MCIISDVHLTVDFFSLENAEVFTEKALIFLEGHWKMPLMKPWWSHGKPKLELNWACSPQVSSISQKSLQKRAQHTHHVKEEKHTQSSLGQKGDKCLQIISFVYIDAVLGNSSLCVRQQLGLVSRLLSKSHPREIVEHPPPLFPHCRFHFRPEIERPPRLLGLARSYRKLLSWLDFIELRVQLSIFRSNPHIPSLH